MRSLSRRPGLAAVAVVTLALGIGANTAIFGVVNTVLLRPSPYRDPDRIVRLASVNPRLGVSDSRSSPPNILDWRHRSTAFEELACFQEWDGVLTARGEAEPVRVNWVTPNLLPVLGIQPVIGRGFLDGDVERGVLLPYGLWQRRFGGDVGAIGQTVTVDDTHVVVVGILPPSAQAPAQGAAPVDQVYIPMDLPRLSFPRDWQLFNVIGRLMPGVSIAQAQLELDGISAELAQLYPDTNGGWGVKATSLRQWETQPVRAQLLAVYAATVIVLLVACLNVSNLLLMRGEARRHELAVRCVLGATRAGLLRQLLAESLVLAAVGGAAGVLLAAWCRRALLGIAPESLGLGTDWSVGPRALLSAGAVTVAAALASGLSPALRLSGGGLHRDLGDAGRSASGGRRRHRLLAALVVAQVAVSTALLAGAALAVVSFRNLGRVEPGFATRNTVSCVLATYGNGASIPRVIDALAALPGVESVGAANIELLDDLHSLPIRVTVDGGAGAGGGPSEVAALTVDYWIVTPGYFAAAGIPLLAGRTFEPRELEDGAPGVAVINEALARRLFPGRDPLGGVVRIPRSQRKEEPGVPKRVVGVATSVKQRGLAAADVPMLYVPDRKVGTGSVALVVRTRTDADAVVAAIRPTVRGVDPTVAVTRVSTTGQIIERSVSGRRFATLLMSAFAALGVLLVAIGLYGVMSYAVAQRTREIGVRMALGAARVAVLRLVLREGMFLAALGIAAGMVATCACARLVRGLLFNVSPTDPGTFAGVAVLVCAVALLACALPARRATRIEPLAALRHE